MKNPHIRWSTVLVLAALVCTHQPGAFAQGSAAPWEVVELPGLKQPVEILVDRWGVPHIFAGNHPGQSGNPDSAHYRDLAPLWLRGEYFPLLYSRSAIEQATELRIRLLPPERSVHNPAE